MTSKLSLVRSTSTLHHRCASKPRKTAFLLFTRFRSLPPPPIASKARCIASKARSNAPIGYSSLPSHGDHYSACQYTVATRFNCEIHLSTTPRHHPPCQLSCEHWDRRRRSVYVRTSLTASARRRPTRWAARAAQGRWTLRSSATSSPRSRAMPSAPWHARPCHRSLPPRPRLPPRRVGCLRSSYHALPPPTPPQPLQRVNLADALRRLLDNSLRMTALSLSKELASPDLPPDRGAAR